MAKLSDFSDEDMQTLLKIIKDHIKKHKSGDVIDLEELINYIYSVLSTMSNSNPRFTQLVLDYFNKTVLVSVKRKDIYDLAGL